MMTDTRRSALKKLGSGSAVAAAAAFMGCDLAEPLPEHKSKSEDCPPLEDIVVSYLAPCVPEEGFDAMEVDLESGMDGISEVEYSDVSGDTCGLYTAGFGQWVQRRIELKITDLTGEPDALQHYLPKKIGHKVTFDIFPKTDTGEGSTLVDINGVPVQNSATRYEGSITQSGLESIPENEAEEFYDKSRGPLTKGDINAVIRYGGDAVESVESKHGFLNIPGDANVRQKNLAAAYG